MSSSSLRLLSTVSKRVAHKPALARSLHSPFIAAAKNQSRLRNDARAMAQVQDYTDVDDVPFRGTYVVCQPEGSANQVPMGAYPVSTPYADFASGPAPNQPSEGK